MSGDQTSQLRLYSLGTVTENKARGSMMVKVHPSEVLPMTEGDLNTSKSNYSTNLPDAKNVKRSENVEGGAIVVAKWIGFGMSNRATPPDVYAGESVVLFKFADTDQYYWQTIFFEPSIRRLETVCYMFSDLPGGKAAMDKNSSYWFEVSTHDKSVKLHTSNTNGEPFIYDVIIDAATGSITIKDDVGNNVILDSKAGSITANALNSLTVVSPKITLDGSVTITKDLNVAEGVTMGGDSNSGGNVKTQGNVEAGQSMTAGGDITASGEVHGSNI